MTFIAFIRTDLITVLFIRPTKASYKQIIYEMLNRTKIRTTLRVSLLISKATFDNK